MNEPHVPKVHAVRLITRIAWQRGAHAQTLASSSAVSRLNALGSCTCHSYHSSSYIVVIRCKQYFFSAVDMFVSRKVLPPWPFGVFQICCAVLEWTILC